MSETTGGVRVWGGVGCLLVHRHIVWQGLFVGEGGELSGSLLRELCGLCPGPCQRPQLLTPSCGGGGEANT